MGNLWDVINQNITDKIEKNIKLQMETLKRITNSKSSNKEHTNK
jgi:hypothetical protein